MNSPNFLLTSNEVTEFLLEMRIQQAEETLKESQNTLRNFLQHPKDNQDRERTNSVETVPINNLIIAKPKPDGRDGIPFEDGPPILVSKGGMVGSRSPIDNQWQSLIVSSQLLIQKSIASVGRIKLAEAILGTCFVLSGNLVVTNKHVIEERLYGLNNTIKAGFQVFVYPFTVGSVRTVELIV
jgi:hypothetical protein